jgi:hypothetical protein
VDHLDLVAYVEELAAQVLRGAGPRGRVVEAAGARTGEGDELLHRLHRHRGVHHHDVRAEGEDRYAGQIARVVVELGIERHVDDQRGGVDEQRVTVGRGLRNVFVGDVGARAGTIVDDHLLAQVLAQLGREQARVDVDAAAGREADDQPDRLAGIRLRRCVRRRGERGQRCQ